VYLIIFFILSICVAVWVLLFLNKPNKTETTGREARKGEKQFVFSNDKPFVASRSTSRTQPIPLETPKPETIKKVTPATNPQKIVQPETQKQESQKKETSPKTHVVLNDSSNEVGPKLNQTNLDFDHLSELIDDFFREDPGTKNSP
jgi:hypothetical protein